MGRHGPIRCAVPALLFAVAMSCCWLTVAVARSSLTSHATNVRPPATLMSAVAFHPSASKVHRRHRAHHDNHMPRNNGMLQVYSDRHHRPFSQSSSRRGITASNDEDQENDSSFAYTTLDDGHRGNNKQKSPTCRRDLQHVLNTIEKAAYSAGKIALSTAGRIAVKSTKANARDLVTESDLACQRLIEKIVTEEFPDDVFLGEEGIDLGGSDAAVASSDALRKALGIAQEGDDGEDDNEDRLLFVVDPIDGTTNFQAGLPMYAVSIGVVSLAGSEPEVVAGAIYNPTLGEMTSAVRGGGCYLNNVRIDPTVPPVGNRQREPRRKTTVLSQSLVNVGFPVCKESTLQVSSRAVTALATRVRGLRMVACASQAMAWVALSKLDAYFSWDLNAWDIAAGMVIVEESGGSVCNFDGTRADVTSRDMIITCRPESVGEEGLLKDELIEVLRDNDCLEYE